MPFPTKDGRSFEEYGEDVKEVLAPLIGRLSKHDQLKLTTALSAIFDMVDAVATEIYYKVWGDETDPSQAPL